jgi:hypothetical protein
MNRKSMILVSIIVLLIISIVIISLLLDNLNQEDSFDVDIKVSTNKDIVKAGETINITLKIKNNRDETIPNDQYFFDLTMINQSEYENGELISTSHLSVNTRDIIESINVPPGETVEEIIPWEIYPGKELGEHYIIFSVNEILDGEYPPEQGQSITFSTIKNSIISFEVVE